MDNPEELLHSLAEFVKLKPKEIPADLEQYLSYVAKTGDPIYQWSLVKALFREKLLNVITEFYETCPTSTDPAPACPNVEFFNYETMKVGLVERLESFASAPFTVQRLCELLTAPHKQYSRADKFMRAVEKNMLVVSTREPGQPRTGQDVDMSNGEEKSWLERQPANASADRAVGLELPAFRYEPFGSAPGTAFFPPLKQKLDDFLETDAAVSAIAPQAANLANLAAISPEQVASLAATIGPAVANLAAEMSPEVANLAAEISPVVANLAAEISPEVATLAAEISPEVASLAAEIAPVVANLAAEILPEVASLAAMSPVLDGANLEAAISSEIPIALATEQITDANPVVAISPDEAIVVATEPASCATPEAAAQDVDMDINPTEFGDAKPGLPQEHQESAATEEKMEVDEPEEKSVEESKNLGEVDNKPTIDKAVDEPSASKDEEKKSSANDVAPTTMPEKTEVAEIAANQIQAGKTPSDLEDVKPAPANEEGAEKIPTNEEEAEPVPVDSKGANGINIDKPQANEEVAEPVPAIQEEAKVAASEDAAEEPSPNEEEAEKQQEDRRQVQSERVQSVIHENMDRDDGGPPAKVPRMGDGPES